MSKPHVTMKCTRYGTAIFLAIRTVNLREWRAGTANGCFSLDYVNRADQLSITANVGKSTKLIYESIHRHAYWNIYIILRPSSRFQRLGNAKTTLNSQKKKDLSSLDVFLSSVLPASIVARRYRASCRRQRARGLNRRWRTDGMFPE